MRRLILSLAMFAFVAAMLVLPEVTNPPLTIRLLWEDVSLALVLIVVAFLLSRFTRDIVGRVLLAIVLLIAALFYVSFVVRAGAGPFWLVVELVQVGVFGTLGVLGVRGSVWWLVAGWTLHPVWDDLVHYFGPGYSFAPITYTIPCLTFDLSVAVYIAVAYGLVGGRRLGFREATP